MSNITIGSATSEATPKSKRIEDLEVLRAIAVMMVFLHHIKGLIYWKSSTIESLFVYFNGSVGVDLFFVISGFIIARSLLPKLQQSSSTRQYFRITVAFWIRRFWRLIPSAWLWLAIPLVLCLCFNDSGAFRTFKGNLAMAISAVLHLANFSFAQSFGQNEYSNVVFQYWSLSLEEQFYVALPFLIFFSRKHLTKVLIALVVVQLLLHRETFSLMLNVVRTDGLFLGVLIAIWQTKENYEDFNPKFLESRLARFIFLGLLILALGTICAKLNIVSPGYQFNVATLLGGIAVFVASFNRNYIVRGGLLKPVLMWLGARSYGIYLAHYGIFALTREIFFRINPQLPLQHRGTETIILYVLTAIVLTSIAVELNYRFIEMPLQNKGRRISKEYVEKKDAVT